MKTAIATLKSISPYSQSRHYTDEIPHLEKEASGDYEDRTWRNRLHSNAEGIVYIPPMAFKNCLSEAAKFLSVKIPGKGKSTYTKHFEAGILVMDPLSLGVHKDSVQKESFFVPSDGRRGSGKRVTRHFPVFPRWTGDVTFYVMDDTVTKDVFEYHLGEAGRFIGIGRFRPRNNGFYGRFEVNKVSWS